MNTKYYRKIIELIEDDYYNLYEVMWYVKSDGDIETSEAFKIARLNVEKLYDDKLVFFFERKVFDGTVKSINNKDKVKMLINSIDNWEVPKNNDFHIVLSISKAGEKYRNENFKYPL